jgi:endo-1,4-beta-xylanase
MRNFWIVFFAVFMPGCRKDVQKLINCDEVALHTLAPFMIGVAVESDRLNFKSQYREKLLKHFNTLTPENSFKFHRLQPSTGVFDWSQADELISFAQQNNKVIHGHTLVWGEYLPEWVKNYQGDFEQLLKKHITTVMTRYRGKIVAWDVVNEAFDDEGRLKNNLWREKIGDDYIEKAFIWAREADPDALLFYNDYNLEAKSKKLNAVTSMLMTLKSSGTPLDGVGIQMHVAYNYPSDRQIKNALKVLSGTGLKVHVSELDVVINQNGTVKAPTFNLLKEQKKRVKTIVEAYGELPPESRYAVTLWGLSDADTWIRYTFSRNDWPLLFDDNYEIKPAFCGFIEGL